MRFYHCVLGVWFCSFKLCNPLSSPYKVLWYYFAFLFKSRDLSGFLSLTVLVTRFWDFVFFKERLLPSSNRQLVAVDRAMVRRRAIEVFVFFGGDISMLNAMLSLREELSSGAASLGRFSFERDRRDPIADCIAVAKRWDRGCLAGVMLGADLDLAILGLPLFFDLNRLDALSSDFLLRVWNPLVSDASKDILPVLSASSCPEKSGFI